MIRKSVIRKANPFLTQFELILRQRHSEVSHIGVLLSLQKAIVDDNVEDVGAAYHDMKIKRAPVTASNNAAVNHRHRARL